MAKFRLDSQASRTSKHQWESSSCWWWPNRKSSSARMSSVWSSTWFLPVLTSTQRSVPQSRVSCIRPFSSLMSTRTQMLSDSVKMSFCSARPLQLSHKLSQLPWELSAPRHSNQLWVFMSTRTRFWSCSLESRTQFNSRPHCPWTNSMKYWQRTRNVKA